MSRFSRFAIMALATFAAISNSTIFAASTTGGNEQPSRMIIKNESGGDVLLYWIGSQSNPRPRTFYARIRPGQTHVQASYVNHRWHLTDYAGHTLKYGGRQLVHGNTHIFIVNRNGVVENGTIRNK